MTEINDYDIYLAGMKKSLMDKVFFIDKIQATSFLDYGCADGELIKFLHELFPKYTYMGYDMDSKMLERARMGAPESMRFATNFDKLRKSIQYEQHTALILSSIIHEVYSYSSSKGIDEFWRRVFDSNFKYIVIRDMVLDEASDHGSNMDDVTCVIRRSRFNEGLEDFERCWGSIENNKNLIHYLLKYRYAENWTREVKENYLPLFKRELLSMIPTHKYKVVYSEHYTLPFLKSEVRKDFGIDLKDKTHFKLILERR